MSIDFSAVASAVVRGASDLKLGDWLAVYGAGLSSVLAFREWRRRSKVRVVVELGDVVDLATMDRRAHLRIRIVNRSDYQVRVMSFGFIVRGQFMMFSRPGIALPAVIPPHDSISSEYPVDSIGSAKGLPGARVRGFAALSTEETFKSSLRGVRFPSTPSAPPQAQ